MDSMPLAGERATGSDARVFYSTTSICPTCLRDLPARVVERNGAAVMLKDCPEHGAFAVTLSKYGETWAGLRSFHQAMHPPEKTPRERTVLLAPTVRCDLDCPFCFMFAGDRPFHEPSLDELRGCLANHQRERITIYGGEPTMREDLPDILRLVCESGNTPVLQTNGVRLADPDYARTLRDAGLAEVFVSFDGFRERSAKKIRAKAIAGTRLTALDNMIALGVPAFLSVAVANDLNHDEMAAIVDYAVDNPVIRGVFFRAAVPFGRYSPPKHYTRADEMLDWLSEQTDGRIDLPRVVRFMRFFSALQPYLSMQRCWHEHFYVVFRDGKGGYVTIDDVLDLAAIDGALDRYAELRRRKSVVAATLLLAANLPRVIRWRRLPGLWMVARNFLRVAAARRLGRGASQRNLSSNTLLLSFTEFCSLNNSDQSKFARCSNRTYDEDGHMVSFCAKNLDRQRRWLAATQAHGKQGEYEVRLG